MAVTDAAISQNLRRNLLVNDGILAFGFTPSIGIGAAKLDKMGVDIRSFREPLKRVVQQVMAPSFKANFEQQGRPDAWEPLSDATMSIRDYAGVDSDTILVRSGLLQRTIQQLNIWTITTTTATIQDLPAKIWYGKLQQAGSAGSGTSKSMSGYVKSAGGDLKEAQKLLDDDLIMAMRGGTPMGGGARPVSAIPQRQFVMIQEDDYDAIEKVFHDWLHERAEAAGLLMVDV
jgi:phage gpG-like protein